MSPRFELVKRHYDDLLWDERRVRDAVDRGWITEEEFELITGKKF